MIELDHNKHRFEGDPGEEVTITLTPDGTNQMVTFVIDGGPAQPLPAGTSLRFNLKNEPGAITRLQLRMEFNGEGSYDITVENVENCPNDPTHSSCTHTRNGPPKIIENHTFIVH